MKSLIIIVYFLVSLPVFSQINEKKIFIDPQNLYGGNRYELFDSINYIILETKKESIIDDISQLKSSEKYIYILDKKSDKVLIFDKKGTFIKSIKDQPDKKLNSLKWNGFVNVFFVESSSTLILAGSFKGKEIYFYFDEGGNYQNEYLESKSDPSFFLDKYDYISLSNYRADYTKKIKSNHHLTFWNNNKLNKSYFPIDSTVLLRGMDDMLNFSSGYEVGTKNVLFSKPGEYKIYYLNNDEIIDVFNLVFPLEFSLPQDLITNKNYESRRYNLFASKPNLIFWLSLQPIFKYKNYLFLSPVSKNGSMHIMYDLHADLAFSLYKIEGRENSSYLPLIGFKGILNVAQNKAYSFISAYELINKNNTLIDNLSDVPEQIKTLIKKGDYNQNPILIEISLK